jgi:hypothetical protein
LICSLSSVFLFFFGTAFLAEVVHVRWSTIKLSILPHKLDADFSLYRNTLTTMNFILAVFAPLHLVDFIEDGESIKIERLRGKNRKRSMLWNAGSHNRRLCQIEKKKNWGMI